ncbi:uncharacterized protein RB166_020698 [Leptodactylus fuscus]
MLDMAEYVAYIASTNCYFCMDNPSKYRSGKNADPVAYPNIPSSIAPVPYYTELPIPAPPERNQPSSEESAISDFEQEDVTDPVYSVSRGEMERYYPNQKDLNNLIQDMGLTKSDAELLTSRLKQWNLLDKSVQVASIC